MASRRRTVDRRLAPRFEVVGDLLGTLELLRPLAVANIGPGGALIESDTPWPIGSVHSIALANGTEIGRAQICVRHVTAAAAAAGAATVFLIGVEFMSLAPALAASIAEWIAIAGGIAEP